MTNEQLDKNRTQIIKDYLESGEILHLENLDISISSSTVGIYHVFSFFGNGPIYNRLHRDSIGDKKLEEIARTLDIDKIKEIFIESRLLKRRKKLVKENEFNPLDWEQTC